MTFTTLPTAAAGARAGGGGGGAEASLGEGGVCQQIVGACGGWRRGTAWMPAYITVLPAKHQAALCRHPQALGQSPCLSAAAELGRFYHWPSTQPLILTTHLPGRPAA